MNKILITFIVFFTSINYSFAQVKYIDLSGNWNFTLDSLNIGEDKEFYNQNLAHTIKLPGTTDEAKYGKKHTPGTYLYPKVKQPEIWGLARKFKYIGKAWYQKTINLPKDWEGKQISLVLERCMWQTKLWVNGKYIGEEHSLATPHQFKVGNYLKSGKNVITIAVDNTPYVHLGTWSHGYAPGIQTIWNGIIGDIKLISKDLVHLDNIQVYPFLKNQQLKIEGNILKNLSKPIAGKIVFFINDKNNKQLIFHREKLKLKKDSTFF